MSPIYKGRGKIFALAFFRPNQGEAEQYYAVSFLRLDRPKIFPKKWRKPFDKHGYIVYNVNVASGGDPHIRVWRSW